MTDSHNSRLSKTLKYVVRNLRYLFAAAIGAGGFFVGVFLYSWAGRAYQADLSEPLSRAAQVFGDGYYHSICPLLLYFWDASPRKFKPREEKFVYTFAPRVFMACGAILVVAYVLLRNYLPVSTYAFDCEVAPGVAWCFTGISLIVYLAILVRGTISRET